MTWLELPELTQRLGRFQERLFRMEARPEYAVAADGDDFTRFIAGETEPTWTRKQPWLDALRAERTARKIRYRVRLLSHWLTDYERYACEWGYALNAEAGEYIKVLRRGEHDIPAGLIEGDFWVIDDAQVVAMHYDEHGRFEAAEVLPPTALKAHITSRDLAWKAAEPFLHWWERHPDLHRPVAV